jgi:hypothetical protein
MLPSGFFFEKKLPSNTITMSMCIPKMLEHLRVLATDAGGKSAALHKTCLEESCVANEFNTLPCRRFGQEAYRQFLDEIQRTLHPRLRYPLAGNACDRTVYSGTNHQT